MVVRNICSFENNVILSIWLNMENYLIQMHKCVKYVSILSWKYVLKTYYIFQCG